MADRTKHTIHCDLTAEQYERVKLAAQAEGASIDAFVLIAVLGRAGPDPDQTRFVLNEAQYVQLIEWLDQPKPPEQVAALRRLLHGDDEGES